MTPFFAGFSAELAKLAYGSMGESDLAKSQKIEDGAIPDRGMNRVIGTRNQTNPLHAGQVIAGRLGPTGGGPLMADPSRWPANRLAG